MDTDDSSVPAGSDREVAARKRLETLLLEGLASEPAAEWTADDWAAIRRRVAVRLSSGKRSPKQGNSPRPAGVDLPEMRAAFDGGMGGETAALALAARAERNANGLSAV